MKTTPIIIALTAIALLQCKATLEKRPFRVRTADHAAQRPLVLASAKQKCKPLFEKRIFHWLFVIPANELSPEERERIAAAGSIRMKQVMTPGDVLITALGFAVSVIARTDVYEQCPGGGRLVADSMLARYRVVEREHVVLERKFRELSGNAGSLQGELDVVKLARDGLVTEKEELAGKLARLTEERRALLEQKGKLERENRRLRRSPKSGVRGPGSGAPSARSVVRSPGPCDLNRCSVK